MENVEFLGVALRVDGHIDLCQYGMGSVELKCEGRSYILDIVSSVSTHIDEGFTIIECTIEVDKETFDETYTKYDLTISDLHSSDLKATIFIGDEYEEEPYTMTLFLKINGTLTKAIDLTNELNC